MITQESAFAEIIRILRSELGVQGEVEGTTTVNSLSLDSLQIMQLLVYLEEGLGFEFSESATTDSVRELTVEGLSRLVASQGAF